MAADPMADALRQCLEALEHHQEQTRPIHRTQEAITAARAALDGAAMPAEITRAMKAKEAEQHRLALARERAFDAMKFGLQIIAKGETTDPREAAAAALAAADAAEAQDGPAEGQPVAQPEPAREPSDEEIDSLVPAHCDRYHVYGGGKFSHYEMTEPSLRAFARAVRAWPGKPDEATR